MAKLKCPKCKKEVEGTPLKCPHCGASFVKRYIGVIASILFLGFCVEQFSGSEGSKDKKLAVRNNIVVRSFPVCVSKKAHDEWSSLAAKDDTAGIQYLFDQRQCFWIKEGVRISILDLGIFSTTKIRAYGNDGTAAELWVDYEFVYENK